MWHIGMVKVLVSYTDAALGTNTALMQALNVASDALIHLIDIANLDNMDDAELNAFINKHDILKGVDPSKSIDEKRAAIKALLT